MSLFDFYVLSVLMCESVAIFDLCFDQGDITTFGEGLLIVLMMLIPVVNLVILGAFMQKGGAADVYNTAVRLYKQAREHKDA